MQQMTMFGLNQPKKEEKVKYKEFTYVSAFAGIGGMTMGLEGLGGKGIVAWEYDPFSKTQYAQEAHKLLHPNIPVGGDICEVDTDNLEYFDVLCFTPPCQSFSVAGKRGGFEDTRGTLTFEALRIAKDKQPKVLFMENVKGLINHDKGNTMGVIINAINEIGYTVDFNVLNSKYFDVAQNRERVYLIAVRNDLISPEPWINIKGNTMLPKSKAKYMNEGAVTFNFDWPKQIEVKTILKDFLEKKVDDKYYLSEDKTANLIKQLENGLAIKEATKVGYAEAKEGDAVNIAFPNSNTRRGRVGKQMANTLEASNINQGVVEKSDSPKMVGPLNMLGNDQIRRVYSTDGQCPTLTTMQGGMQQPKITEEIRPILTPDRLEKRQNGRRFKEDGEESFTITTIDRHGVAIGKYPKYRIRKLTPRECLRLQSIPEDKIELLLENFSDSRCYKFAGNGLTTNVIKSIGEKLLKYL